jgi:Zn-dependent peptidase ImmA (M78 family)
VLRHGFKAWCERVAVDRRTDLGLSPTDPLAPRAVAAGLGIRVWEPADVPEMPAECLDVLLRVDPESWSAVTLRIPGADLIIVNSAHSLARQASDLMHELSHVLLGHKPTRVDVTEDEQLLLRTHDAAQEEEASWLAGCLLLPRPCLVSIIRNSAVNRATARRYGVSLEMLNYRVRVTGVAVQARRAGRF